MAAAAPAYPRQYEIEFGPFTTTAAGNQPTFTPRLLTNLKTHNSYLWVHLVQNLSLPAGLLFSRGGFLTNHYHTPEMMQSETDLEKWEEPGRSLWIINLVPIRCQQVADNVNNVSKLDNDLPLLRTGNITNLRWGKKYILEPDGLAEGVMGVLLRAVDLIPGAIDEMPPVSVHGGQPDLGPRLLSPKKRKGDNNDAEMPGLLSRLQALTNS